MRCAIYGAGSLGTVLGAYLTKNNIPVELINRNWAHVAALNEKGAVICGTLNMQVPVKAMLPEDMNGLYDVIFLMTKQLENKAVVTCLKDFLAPEGVLVTFQNGLPEPEIEAILGRGRTIGCVVEWGATLKEAGVCELTSDPASLSFHMGGMEGVSPEKISQVKDILEKMCPVHIEENLLGARWSKLLINATFSGLGTVMGGTFGTVSETKAAQPLALACMKEVMDVGRATGVQFAPVQGKDITKLFYYSNPVKKAFARALLPVAMKKHRMIEPSMLQDVKKGKPCEVDAINGVVCAWGKKTGVPTPINDRIVEIVHRIEAGELKPGAENLKLFQ